jgi:NADH-quinone oxidoreductase subunit N
MSFDVSQLAALAPMLVLVGMGCLVLLAETFVRGKSRGGLMWISAASCVAALVILWTQWEAAATKVTVLQGMWVVDRMALFFDAVFIATALVTVLVADPFMREHRFEFGEFYAIVLFGTGGMMMVSHADHLLALLIGIETMSLAAYVLTGCWRRSSRSAEGALKYFLMGAFATAFLVYGMALIYGLTGGELTYAGIAAKAGEAAQSPIFLLGFYLLLAALVFKVSAVPFHFWAPDAYEGAPTPVTGFMAAGVKAAAFAGALRLLGEVFGGSGLPAGDSGWVPVISVLAFLTMTVGNLAALRQENVKRMLAYSSVAHAGYVLIGVAALGLGVADAQPAVLFYLAAYTFTTLGTFAVVAWVGRRGDERLFIDDWAGLGTARPALALGMTVFLLSLGGVPPTGGFFGKFYLFRAAIAHPALVPLVIAGVLNSVVSIYYYLRVVVAMYFRDPIRPHDPFPAPSLRAGLVLTAIAVVALGVLPGPIVEWAAGGGGPATTVAKLSVLVP